MDMKQLEYFMVLCEHDHMSSSAEFIGISQPALSKSISNLEKEVGVKLFDRTGNAIHLNEQGRSFAIYAQKALDDLQHGLHVLHQSRYDVLGEIRITCHTFADILAGCITEYARLNPRIKFAINEGKPKDSDLVNTSDFILTTQAEVSDADSTDRAWYAAPLFSEEYVVAISPRYRVYPEDQKEIRIGDLKNDLFVDMPDVTVYFADITHTFCRMAGFAPRIFLSTNTFLTKIRYVDSGNAICIIPECCMERALRLSPDLRFFHISDYKQHRTIFLQHRRESMMSEAVMDFWNFVQDYFSHPEEHPEDPLFRNTQS